MKYLILRILIFMVLEYCKAPWTTNGRWRYINAYLFIYLFILFSLLPKKPILALNEP